MVANFELWKLEFLLINLDQTVEIHKNILDSRRVIKI